VVDPTKTICADFSQGNTKKFRQNSGKQCLAMSLTAIIYNHITQCKYMGFNYIKFHTVCVLEITFILL
jgi:hypothetical protein